MSMFTNDWSVSFNWCECGYENRLIIYLTSEQRHGTDVCIFLIFFFFLMTNKSKKDLLLMKRLASEVKGCER